MARNFFRLLADTWVSLEANWKQLVAGVFLGAFLLFLSRSLYLSRLEQYRLQFIEGVGINAERARVADLQKKKEAGDSAAAAELRAISDKATKRLQGLRGRTTQALSAYQSQLFVSEMGFPLFLAALFLVALTLGSGMYFFLLTLEGGEPLRILLRMKDVTLETALLSAWVFCFSFLWVPVFTIAIARFAPFLFGEGLGTVQMVVLFLGYFFTILLLPRYVLSFLYTLRDKMKASESAQESYRRTYGYWGKILGNLLMAFALCLIAYSIIVWFGRLILPSGNPLIAVFLRACAFEIGIALWTVFMAKLSLTVQEHPILRLVVEEPSASAVGLSAPGFSKP